MVVINQGHIAACHHAWKSCEKLLLDLQLIKHHLAQPLLTTIDECALICMGAYYAFESGSVNSANMALLCIGICEDCADVCRDQAGTGFITCEQACNACANSLSDFKLNGD